MDTSSNSSSAIPLTKQPNVAQEAQRLAALLLKRSVEFSGGIVGKADERRMLGALLILSQHALGRELMSVACKATSDSVASRAVTAMAAMLQISLSEGVNGQESECAASEEAAEQIGSVGNEGPSCGSGCRSPVNGEFISE